MNGEHEPTGQDLSLQPADEVTGEATWYLPGAGAVQMPYVRLGVRNNTGKDAAPGEPFQQFDGAPFRTASTDAYPVADFAAGFSLGTVDDRQVQRNLKIRNLTAERYRDFLDTCKGYALSAGRDVRVQVRLPGGG